MPLPDPLFTKPAEPFKSSDETQCDPNAHRPGVLAFKDFVIAEVGGGSYGTARPCAPGSVSGHHSARAWDWAMDAHDPVERAAADELLDWLTANDGELFRRAGIAYMIWDKRTWSAFKPYWHPYGGYDEQGKCTRLKCRDPHTNHVHFSFNWPGAEGTTSFYDWLTSGRPVKQPEPPPVPPVIPVAPVNFVAKVIPFLAGGLLGYAAYQYARTQWGKQVRA